MVRTPPLPDEYVIPKEVNGWVRDPGSNRNGHIWTGTSVERSVGVFLGVTDRIRVAVFDDRVDGFRNKIEPVERDIKEQESQSEATAWGIDRAVTWMVRHAPTEWDHPHVEEAVFDPPVGYVLDRYYLEEREHIVNYRRADAESVVKMAGGRIPKTPPSLDTCAYLIVKTWRGSGNSTIALAPWLRAHDKELHEVVNLPEGCGLPIALKLAREFVQEQTGQSPTSLPTGQSDLADWI